MDRLRSASHICQHNTGSSRLARASRSFLLLHFHLVRSHGYVLSKCIEMQILGITIDLKIINC